MKVWNRPAIEAKTLFVGRSQRDLPYVLGNADPVDMCRTLLAFNK
ncbi:MAG: hypothetical protein ACE5NG_13245 [bacterium]